MAGDIAAVIYVYQRRRKDLGRPCDFKDAGPGQLVDSFPDRRQRQRWTTLNLVECELSNVSPVSEQGTNTERKQSRSRGQLHLEGSWPKDVDDVEHKLRYRKKAEKDDSYLPALKSLVSAVEGVVDENNAIDIYDQYFSAVREQLPLQGVVQPGSGWRPGPQSRMAHADPSDNLGNTIQTITVFCDPLVSDTRSGRVPTTKPHRTVSSVAWQPVEGLHGRRMAVSYANLSSPHANATMCTLDAGETLNAYIWDLTNSNAPELTLEPPAQLVCLEYNLKDLHLLGGGSQDGALCCFDCRRGGRPVLSTPLFADDQIGTAPTGATEAVGCGSLTSIKWLHSTGKGHELLAANGSNIIRIWDTRLLRDPLDTIVLHNPKDGGESLPGGYSALCLDYDPQIGGGTRFLAGTGSGSVFLCSTRGRSPTDHITSVHAGHHGPVCAVRRSPQVARAFLSCGDWTVRIWHEDLRTPVIVSRYQKSCVVDASWHPSQAGVFVSAQMDGTVDFWNLACKQLDPLLSVPVTTDRLHCLRLHPGGELAAAGSCNGRTHLLRLPRRLIEPSGVDPGELGLAEREDETSVVVDLLEREAARERNLQQSRRDRESTLARSVQHQVERKRSTGENRAVRAQQESRLMQVTANYICEMEHRCSASGVMSQLGTLRRRFMAAAPQGKDLLDRAQMQQESVRNLRGIGSGGQLRHGRTGLWSPGDEDRPHFEVPFDVPHRETEQDFGDGVESELSNVQTAGPDNHRPRPMGPQMSQRMLMRSDRGRPGGL